MNFFNVENSLEKLFDSILLKLPSIFVGFLLLFVGRFVIRFLLNFIDRRFEKRDVDLSIRTFIRNLVKIVLYILLILTVANTMGIQTTSFIAALSAFGLAVGMALQGSLSNFAGGVLILLFRPFEVGDYIASENGSSGSVVSIDLLYTTIIDDDGIRLFSPNGTLANSVIRNYTKIASRRMQFTMLISYDTDIKTARKHILQILNEDSRILKSPAPEVVVGDLKETGISLTMRAWANREVFWATKNELAEEIKLFLERESSVFPVNVVKVLNEDKNSDNTSKQV